MIRTLSILALCLPLLTPGIASAKKPLPLDSACGLYVWPGGPLNPGDEFNVKVFKIISYPGHWIHPTITIDITYPGKNPNGDPITRKLEYTGGYYVTYWETNFTVPGTDEGIQNGVVSIKATIKEPIIKNNKSPNNTVTYIENICQTKTEIELEPPQ